MFLNLDIEYLSSVTQLEIQSQAQWGQADLLYEHVKIPKMLGCHIFLIYLKSAGSEFTDTG